MRAKAPSTPEMRRKSVSFHPQEGLEVLFPSSLPPTAIAHCRPFPLLSTTERSSREYYTDSEHDEVPSVSWFPVQCLGQKPPLACLIVNGETGTQSSVAPPPIPLPTTRISLGKGDTPHNTVVERQDRVKSLSLNTARKQTTPRALRAPSSKVELLELHFSPRDSRIVVLIAVKNLAFQKSVKLRLSIDGWRSFVDVDCSYAGPFSKRGSIDEDLFRCDLTLPQLYQELQQDQNLEKVKISFCVQYQVLEKEYWDNNEGQNYHVCI